MIDRGVRPRPHQFRIPVYIALSDSNDATIAPQFSTKGGELESKDLLKRRIEEASRYVPIEQLCLSPQCGFSSTVEGNALTRDEQRAKLELIVETASEVWG